MSEHAHVEGVYPFPAVMQLPNNRLLGHLQRNKRDRTYKIKLTRRRLLGNLSCAQLPGQR
jgi:hypothetical protein